MGDDENRSTVLQRVERADLERAGDIDLGLSQNPTWLERGRLWANERLSKAQTQALEAKQQLHAAAASFLRSQENLQEEIERHQHWKSNIDAIRERVRGEFDAEEDERAIRRAERRKRLAEIEREAKKAEGELATIEAQIEADRRRREANPLGDSRPISTAEDIFRLRVEQILNHGSVGRFMPIADEYRTKLIVERGGEEQLTDDDRARIELIFELARRQQESKS